jgi:hypothetical protein
LHTTAIFINFSNILLNNADDDYYSAYILCRYDIKTRTNVQVNYTNGQIKKKLYEDDIVLKCHRLFIAHATKGVMVQVQFNNWSLST